MLKNSENFCFIERWEVQASSEESQGSCQEVEGCVTIGHIWGKWKQEQMRNMEESQVKIESSSVTDPRICGDYGKWFIIEWLWCRL